MANKYAGTKTEQNLRAAFSGEDGADRYDSSFLPHGHLFCIKCRRISDFEYPRFSESLSELIGTGVESYELKVRYICPLCKERE